MFGLSFNLFCCSILFFIFEIIYRGGNLFSIYIAITLIGVSSIFVSLLNVLVAKSYNRYFTQKRLYKIIISDLIPIIKYSIGFSLLFDILHQILKVNSPYIFSMIWVLPLMLLLHHLYLGTVIASDISHRKISAWHAWGFREDLNQTIENMRSICILEAEDLRKLEITLVIENILETSPILEDKIARLKQNNFRDIQINL